MLGGSILCFFSVFSSRDQTSSVRPAVSHWAGLSGIAIPLCFLSSLHPVAEGHQELCLEDITCLITQSLTAFKFFPQTQEVFSRIKGQLRSNNNYSKTPTPTNTHQMLLLHRASPCWLEQLSPLQRRICLSSWWSSPIPPLNSYSLAGISLLLNFRLHLMVARLQMAPVFTSV